MYGPARRRPDQTRLEAYKRQLLDLEDITMSKGIRKITTIGVLLAIQIVLSRFLTISLPAVEINLGFLPIAITAILYGPLWGAASSLMGDLISTMMGPYAYYPPMSITALLIGAAYGLFLYRKPASLPRICCCVLAERTLLSLLLQTYWLTLLIGKGFWALLPTRLIQFGVTVPLHIVLIWLVAYRVAARAGQTLPYADEK